VAAMPRWGDRAQLAGRRSSCPPACPPEVVAATRHLPQGEGLLEAQIEGPAPMRLRTVVEDTRSDGVPARAPADAGLLMLCRAANASGRGGDPWLFAQTG
jgi:hypothetical protein